MLLGCPSQWLFYGDFSFSGQKNPATAGLFDYRLALFFHRLLEHAFDAILFSPQHAIAASAVLCACAAAAAAAVAASAAAVAASMALFAALDAERASDIALLILASTAASCSGLTDDAQPDRAPITTAMTARESIFRMILISYQCNQSFPMRNPMHR
jgi:hypothetical protein